MNKKTLLAAALAALAAPASAHLAIKTDLIAPGGTRWNLWTDDESRSGNIPGSGGMVFYNTSVVGYYDHGPTETVNASFVTAGGATVNCAPQTFGVYEPAWHFATTCRPTFRFDGAACSASCEVVPMDPPDANAKPKAFPNPLKPPEDGVNFINLPSNARVRIYGPTGALIFEKNAGVDGKMHWHGDDRSGRPVGTGVYSVVAKGDGKTATLKVAVQR